MTRTVDTPAHPTRSYERLRPAMRLFYLWTLSRSRHVPSPRGRPTYRADSPDPDTVLLIGTGPTHGFGVTSHEQALTGQIAKETSKSTGRACSVDYIGDEMMNAGSARSWIGDHDLSLYDTVVVMLGLNDAVMLTPLDGWQRDVSGLVTDVTRRVHPTARIVLVGVQPVRSVTRFDNPFGSVAERHAARMNEITERIASQHPSTSYFRLPAGELQPGRPHGCETMYRQWGAVVADRVAPTLDVVRRGEAVEHIGRTSVVPVVPERVAAQLEGARLAASVAAPAPAWTTNPMAPSPTASGPATAPAAVDPIAARLEASRVEAARVEAARAEAARAEAARAEAARLGAARAEAARLEAVPAPAPETEPAPSTDTAPPARPRRVLPEPTFEWSGAEKLVELASSGGSDTLQDLARRAEKEFGVDVAVVSLLDGKKLYYAVNTELLPVSIPRELTFCDVTVAADAPVIVEDARKDDRFKDNPYLDLNHGYFYAGHPIHSSTGEAIGTFCLHNTRPRKARSVSSDKLAEFARLAEIELQSYETADGGHDLPTMYETREAAVAAAVSGRPPQAARLAQDVADAAGAVPVAAVPAVAAAAAPAAPAPTRVGRHAAP
ncbi:GAF domain-containing protein [Frigoribacterium sp. PhB24]|uniref:GAF domain-containing protein n=1 Tax=Frigoribacterium sp. PhB24 TaxID=2485204 RepID=UPI000F4AC703|nr:GAF domain-containing protein [Frigoribacterium sp. PhB24]ROS52583.1 GAF domain-containing protein [Frigoribacterium sp. PhB24]